MNNPDLDFFSDYIIGISGGKDSTATALWMLDRFPKDKIHLVHNPTGAGWPENVSYLEYLEDFLNHKIISVAAGDFPFPTERDDWYSGPTLFDMIRGRGRWPSFWTRYCTRYLKQVPIRQYAYQFSNPLLVFGIRADESKGRSQLNKYDTDDKGYSDWVVYKTPKYHPILEWSKDDVYSLLDMSGVKHNPIYQYTDRVGCWCCPLKNGLSDIKSFCRRHPDLAYQAFELEKEIGHTWKYNKSIGEVLIMLQMEQTLF